MVYSPFREHIQSNFSFLIPNLNHVPKNSQSQSLIKYLSRGDHFELGAMAHILRLCNGRTANKEELIGELRSYIKEILVFS